MWYLNILSFFFFFFFWSKDFIFTVNLCYIEFFFDYNLDVFMGYLLWWNIDYLNLNSFFFNTFLFLFFFEHLLWFLYIEPNKERDWSFWYLYLWLKFFLFLIFIILFYFFLNYFFLFFQNVDFESLFHLLTYNQNNFSFNKLYNNFFNFFFQSYNIALVKGIFNTWLVIPYNTEDYLTFCSTYWEILNSKKNIHLVFPEVLIRYDLNNDSFSSIYDVKSYITHLHEKNHLTQHLKFNYKSKKFISDWLFYFYKNIYLR